MLSPIARIREAWRARRALARFPRFYIADTPVDLGGIGEFRNDAFPMSGPYCWLDRPDALAAIERREKAGEITAAQAEICERWTLDGYHIARGLIPRETLDAAFAAYEAALADGRIVAPAERAKSGDALPARVLDPHLHVPEIKALQRDERILAITDLLLGRKTVPFQTIIGHKGSGQSAHSDLIHMTTYPLGYLAACWIAMEDVHADSGPLEYFPRSHRLLPPLLSGEIGIAPLEYKVTHGAVYGGRYEPAIRRYVKKLGLVPEVFLAEAGDVLFWHANLLHGGAKRKDLTLSRKALVCHYFAEGVVTYHDLSGNPSRLHRSGMLERIELD
jgi:ectoine hydroxylase-related dioxygenase (phytanoyl-CoA dioxygenase family)